MHRAQTDQQAFLQQNLDKLPTWESENKVWETRFLGIPLWAAMRPLVVKADHERPALHLNIAARLKRLLVSIWQLIRFWFSNTKGSTLLCVVNRPEYAALANYFAGKCKKVFVLANYENQQEVFSAKEYHLLQSEFFNFLRFYLRKVTWMFLLPVFLRHRKKFLSWGFSKQIESSLKASLGDVFYFRLIEKFFAWQKLDAIYYTFSVFPVSSRYSKTLNLIELQHGFIDEYHPNYYQVPFVSQAFAVKNESYAAKVKNMGYSGEVISQPEWFAGDTKQAVHAKVQHYPLVIFTQPLPKFQKALAEFLQRCGNQLEAPEIYLKLHPRDYFSYPVARDRIISSWQDATIDCYVCYFSSVIEEIWEAGHRNVVIFDAGDVPRDKLEGYLKQMTGELPPDPPIYSSLDFLVGLEDRP